MNRLHFAWLAVLAAFTLAFAGCDALSEDDSSGAPSVEDGTEYIVVDDSGSGALTGLMNGAVTLGPNDVVVRIDAAGDGKWVAEDADGKAVFWGTAEVLPSGFYDMKITGSKVDDPAKGTEVIGFEVASGVLFVMGVDSFDATNGVFKDEDTVGINVDGSCPANGTTNNNFLNTPNGDSVVTTDIDIGTAELVTSGGSTAINTEDISFDGDFTGFTGTHTAAASGLACDAGFAENTGGDGLVFTGAGFHIVFPSAGTGAVIFPQPSGTAITTSDVAAVGKSYRGVGQRVDGSGIPEVSAIAVEGQGSNMLYGAGFTSVANIRTDTVDVDPVTNTEAATLTLNTTSWVDQYFDTSSIDVADTMPTMVMELPNGKLLIMALVWTDVMSDTLTTDDDWELIILVEQ